MKCSVSRMKLFKACRRAYYFKYVEDLEPVEKAEALQTGSNYHEYVECLYNNHFIDNDYTKECAMARAYQKYILPKVDIVETEKWFEKKIGRHVLIGRVDGISADGCVVEHKTTSSDIAEGGEYEYNLQWDEQILAYMSLTGCRTIHYTVCKKPTIRMKQNESEEEFFARMCEWYETDTDKKIRTFDVTRTDEEVAEWEKDFEQMCDEMEIAEKAGRMYRCTNHCNAWGRRCEYSGICLHYDPRCEYVEFMKGGRR